MKEMGIRLKVTQVPEEADPRLQMLARLLTPNPHSLLLSLTLTFPSGCPDEPHLGGSQSIPRVSKET